MKLEDKMKRNIKQIIDRGESAEMYFLDKLQSECVELIRVMELIRYNLYHGYDFSDIQNIYYVTVDEAYGEIADVLNCIEYITILFDLDRDKIDSIRNYKLDRGYERGKSNE